MTVWRAVGGIVLVLLLLPGQASAVDLNQWVPGLKVLLHITERAEYQTNVQQVKAHTNDDLISRTVPGVDIKIGRAHV